MIRIGDCGDLNGNDYSMLNCKQGYSVDKTCGSLDKCFPIFDKNGNVLKGVEATLELINTAKILPTVCLEKADKTKYKLNFAMTEKNIVSGRKILLNKYNNLININFDENNGIDALFDKNSGSVLLPMYEWEILPFSNPLKEFWSLKNNNCYKYVMRDDNNFLLRGSSTYYYFIANRISINDKDITSKNDVLRWYNNYIEFFKEAACAIFQTDNINFTINKRLILGILDNCRNALLIIMNNILVSKSINNNILMDISKKDNKLYFEIYKLLLKIESIMSYMCFKTNYLIDKNLICDVIHQTEKILEDNLLIEKLAKNKEDYSKDYRAYREIDNFGENYIAVSLYRERRNNIEIPINVCGLSYGGIELPIIAKILAKNRIEKILLLKFSKEVSRYSNKQLIDLRNFNINEHGGLLNFETFQETSLDLFDDNVLTGKTLQLAIISLYDYNINVKNICIVRYPGINRIEQMFLNTVAAIDYHLFFDYIYGLCFSIPYSWKDNEWMCNDNKYDYKDSIGVFDLNRKKIIECIIKNHDYKIGSEVEEYGRKLLRKQ